MTDPINPYADEPRSPPQRSDAVTRLDQTEPASPIVTGRRQEERHVLHIELAMQNANLRQTQLELEAQLDRYIDLYEMAPIGYLTLNQDGVIKQANLTADAMLKSPRSDLLNRPFAEWVAVADWGRWSVHFQHVLQQDERDLLQGDSADNVELELLRSDGTLLTVRIDALCLKTAIDDSVVRIALTDISARKQAEQIAAELRTNARDFESCEPMMVSDPAGKVLRINSAFTRRTGYTTQDIVGQHVALLQSLHHDPSYYQRLYSALKEHGYWQGTLWGRHKDGNSYAEWLVLTAVYAHDGSIDHYVASFSEVRDSREGEADIHRMAYFDPLTMLPNRRLLYDRLGQVLASCTRSGRYGALLFLDLDNFKSLNDTHGHDVGDLLLSIVARRLEVCIRREDTVARLGGDEFVIVLESLSPDAKEAAQQAGQVADKILTTLRQPYDLEGPEYPCSASLGIVLFNSDQRAIKQLLKQADMALYQAKNAGRNTRFFYDEAMQAQQDERSALNRALQQAVPQQQLRLHYQAQLDYQQQLIGVEALLRWDHPQHGTLEPHAFIALAEESGAIVPIGKWVMEMACAQIARWSKRSETASLQIAVNVSLREFCQTNFVEQVQQTLAASAADPARLRMEFKESLVNLDPVDTAAKMHALKTLGVSLALDGFGTGVCSLANLAKLPLDQLKIDRSLTCKLDSLHEPGNMLIAQTIIALGHSLGMDIIAEGVETEIQRTFLQRHGCLAYQGYLMGRPLELTSFEAAYLH